MSQFPTRIAYWGKDIEDMSREELIDVIKDMAEDAKRRDAHDQERSKQFGDLIRAQAQELKRRRGGILRLFGS